MNRSVRAFFASMYVLALIPGCASCGFDASAMKDRIAARPVELDRLNALSGKWRTEGEVRMLGLGDPIHTTGKSEANWECDRRLLVERSSFDMGTLGPMSGVSVWSFDARSKHYEMHWFDSFGESAKGTAWFNAKKNTWEMRVRGRNAITDIVADGTIRIVNDDTLEWTWKQYDAWHLLQFADMKGRSVREP